MRACALQQSARGGHPPSWRARLAPASRAGSQRHTTPVSRGHGTASASSFRQKATGRARRRLVEAPA